MTDQPKISDPSYQDKDIGLGILSASVAGIAVVILAAFLGMKALFKSYEAEYTKANPQSPLSFDRVLPPQPMLQVDEAADWKSYYEQEKASLEARTPIAEAKQMVLKQGLGPLSPGGAQ